MTYLGVDKSNLHDYELLDIIVNYSNSEINIKLNSPKNTASNIVVHNFSTFTLSHKEPWGKGKYICFSEIKKENNINTIEIELNSGDYIIIEYYD